MHKHCGCAACNSYKIADRLKPIRYFIRQNAYEVEGCLLLREAAELLKAGPYDLIISDIGLPDGNGLNFCSRYGQIPFIAMSSTDHSELAKADGAKAYIIEKPFNIGDMLADIASLE